MRFEKFPPWMLEPDGSVGEVSFSNTQFYRKGIRKIDSCTGHDIRNSPDNSLSCLLMRRMMMALMMMMMMSMVMTAGYISVPTDVMCFLKRLHNSPRSAAGVSNYSIRPYGRSHDLWGGGTPPHGGMGFTAYYSREKVCIYHYPGGCTGRCCCFQGNHGEKIKGMKIKENH